MSLRTFTCFVSIKGSNKFWTEQFTRDVEDPREYAEELIRRFNESRWPHEKERVLRSVRHDRLARYADHEWEKTNLVTVSKGGEMFDTYQCSRCKITGRRYGLQADILRDRKFLGPNFLQCNLFALRARKRLT